MRIRQGGFQDRSDYQNLPILTISTGNKVFLLALDATKKVNKNKYTVH